MRRFALIYTVCALVSVILVGPVTAQYPREDARRSVNTPSAGLIRLQSMAPGHSVVVTMNDGTLRGGWAKSVDDTNLNLEKQGGMVALSIGDIATVRVQRSDRTLWYAMFGYIVTATAATIIAYNNDDHNAYNGENRKFQDLAIIFAVSGIPGGVIGAAIGHHRTGDVEIVP